MQSFERAVELDPSFDMAHYMLGRTHLAMKRYALAVHAHNNLAIDYMETGRLDKAQKAVEAAGRAGVRVAPALKEEIRKRKVDR